MSASVEYIAGSALTIAGFVLAVWVLFRTGIKPGLRNAARVTSLLRVAAIMTGLFALGAFLLYRYSTFAIGEIIVFVLASFTPFVWALYGELLLRGDDKVPGGPRRLLTISAALGLLLAVSLYVANPPIENRIWQIDGMTHWLFFIFLLLGVWTLTVYERLWRWAASRIRQKAAWFRLVIVLFFGSWVLAAGEGFLWRQFHALWLPWLALCQSISLLGLLRFSKLQQEEDVPFAFSRQAAYTSVIIILLGLYLIFLGIIGAVIRWAGGDVGTYLSVLAALSAVILLLILIALPSVSRRVRRFVDRGLYKGRLDAAAEWTRITDEISGILDLPSLVKTVAQFLEEAFSEQISIYLPSASTGRLSLYYPFEHGEVGHSIAPTGEAADWLWRLGEPIVLELWINHVTDEHDRNVLTHLRDSTDGQIVMPLMARRRFLGFVILGRRRGEQDYNDEDLEFLTAIAGPIAFAVMTGQVSEELVAQREMASFNRVASFIIHDLKNAVSMLSMMLQNAEQHIADPSFQQSALSTVRDAVTRMQNLIGKVSGGGKELTHAARKPVDLNRTVHDVISRLDLTAQSKLRFSFDRGEIPSIQADSSQVTRVVENLIVNALESVTDHGRMQIKTDLHAFGSKHWVRCQVIDDGCGMSAEFIATKLFKPFTSTKKSGLGIGMYQVKQMIEADQGHIHVTSAEGKGTRFEVLWPQAASNAEIELG